MPGGVMWGYCATGSVRSASPPISVMTTDSTVAKIGRSMKKLERMAQSPCQIRNPKSERNLKFKIINLKPLNSALSSFLFSHSDFFRISDFGFRISDFFFDTSGGGAVLRMDWLTSDGMVV
jgi:hypothetical protein